MKQKEEYFVYLRGLAFHVHEGGRGVATFTHFTIGNLHESLLDQHGMTCTTRVPEKPGRESGKNYEKLFRKKRKELRSEKVG